MKIILVGVIAALGSLLSNRYLVKEFGNLVIIYLAPLIEESFKSFLAYHWSINIPLVHLVFGAVEAIYDFYSSAEHRISAGTFSLLSHSIFGYITWLIYQKFNDILLGVFVAIIIHSFWNYIVLKIPEGG
jgi:hypothetical protein